MEMNIPTAAPFFTGINNQIMYCISTPNISWNASNQPATYTTEQKKPISGQAAETHQPPPQYYYSTTVAITQNPSAFNPVYSSTSTFTTATQPKTTYSENTNEVNKHGMRDGKMYEEQGRNFECSVCHKKFRQRGTLSQHERIHLTNINESKPFQCVHCEKRFRQKAILNQHLRIHFDASAQLVYKNLGQNGTLWPQNVPYPEEITSTSDIESKDSMPQIVHSVFGAFNESNRTDENKTGDQKVTMQKPLYVRCPICQQQFKQKSTLVQRGCIHIESRPYSCLFINCGKRFRQQSHLQQHNRIHENSKPYQCPYEECQKCFRQQTILNQHLRIHTNSKPYHCKTCFKEFRQQAILSQHEKSHMTLSLACPLTNCKRRFANEIDLRKHIEHHMNPNAKPKRQSKNSISNLEYNKQQPEVSFTQSYPYSYNSVNQPRN